MMDREAYVERNEAQLREYEAKIAELKAKIDQLKADARIKYEQEIMDLEKRHRSLTEDLSKLKKAGKNAWVDMKTGLDKAWQDFKDAFEQTRTASQ